MKTTTTVWISSDETFGQDGAFFVTRDDALHACAHMGSEMSDLDEIEIETATPEEMVDVLFSIATSPVTACAEMQAVVAAIKSRALSTTECERDAVVSGFQPAPFYNRGLAKALAAEFDA